MSGIVVGVDGSRESITALRFAVEEAALRKTGVLAVYALKGTGYAGTVLDEANRVFDAASAEAFGGSAPAVPFDRLVEERPPVVALVEAAGDADLLVVGSRGRGGFAGLLLGSVSQQVAHHAPGPVAIVRAQTPVRNGAVLVGVDASAESKQALHWGEQEARLRGARLVALHAWAPPVVVGPGLIPMPMPLDMPETDVEAFLDGVLVEVLGEERAPEAERRTVQAPAALGLAEAASAGDLLVVGSRGHGGFAGLLLGSVSPQVALHAPCPVVIVR